MRTTLAQIGRNVQIPYQPALNPTGAFTVEIWAKPGQTAETADMFMAYAPESETGNFGGWRLSQWRSDPAYGDGFSFYVFDTTGDVSFTRAAAPMVLSTSSWYHVVGVFDGTQVELYVNGQRIASSPIPAGQIYRPNPWAGTLIGGHNYWYLGALDEPAIYPRALPAAEVLDHYQAGTSATPPIPYRDVVLGDNPVGYWPFD